MNTKLARGSRNYTDQLHLTQYCTSHVNIGSSPPHDVTNGNRNNEVQVYCELS